MVERYADWRILRLLVGRGLVSVVVIHLRVEAQWERLLLLAWGLLLATRRYTHFLFLISDILLPLMLRLRNLRLHLLLRFHQLLRLHLYHLL